MRRSQRAESGLKGLEIGMAWYSTEDWARIKETAADPDVFHDTYEEWQIEAQERFDAFVADGMSICKVQVDAEEYIKWCLWRGVPRDGKSRSEYASRRGSETTSRQDLFRSLRMPF